ncbi:hypothetical protein AB1286_23995 [Trinickia sp. NRRL B-1857]|uniref:hypothetical protein n=1 Tax=Trinickia sp. NRRL B-1857 TaxID=3162879 RepID=UPI003D2B6608
MSNNHHRPAQAEVLNATARASRAQTGAPRVETELGRRCVSPLAIIAVVMLLPMTQARADNFVAGSESPNAAATIGGAAAANRGAAMSIGTTVVAGVRG